MFKFVSKTVTEFDSHIGDDIRELIKQAPIPLCIYQNIKINSYEDKFIEPYLSNEAFVWKVENALKWSSHLTSHQLPRHYDEYLATDAITELLKRFKDFSL